VEDPQEKQDRRLRSLFDGHGLPASESVRKTYKCLLIIRPSPIPVELFVTSTHLCFWTLQHSQENNRREVIPFTNLLAINKKNRLFVPVGIELVLKIPTSSGSSSSSSSSGSSFGSGSGIGSKEKETTYVLEGFENAETVFETLLQLTNATTQSRGKRILAKITSNRPKITSLGSHFQ
jgi:hypothetical protein